MGARLVTAVETEEGRRWAESKIKALTGGDQIAARFMRQDFFEFAPRFKLVIAGNHKPGLRSVDEAIRRRFHLVPFGVTIPPEDRDKDLANKLKVEWQGILQWMIEGCLKWQAEGLRRPQVVLDATSAYLEAEDAVAAWIEERCELGPNNWETSAKLFSSWKEWAETQRRIRR
jgi:putative DNA primase/helicase